MKPWLIATVVVGLLAGGLPQIADAKRLGGSKSFGMQRNMPARTAPPPSTPPKPATPANGTTPAQQQAVPGAAAAAPAAAGAAAAAGKRSWMGPIAGLAAGLGLAALMSHFGMGEAFANFLMLALLAVAAVFVIGFLIRRFGGGAARGGPALAGAGVNAGTGAGGMATASTAGAQAQRWSAEPMARTQLPSAHSASAASAAGSSADQATVTPPPLTDPVLPPSGTTTTEEVAATPLRPALAPVFVPASFDSEVFARAAKAIFIRLQAANDAGDLDDLRRFTTPEMFAELRLDLQDRGGVAQHTDVQAVNAEVLDVAEEDGRQIVSVRYRGQIVETAGAAAEDFDEIWHLAKPLGEGGSWVIAGIEQGR